MRLPKEFLPATNDILDVKCLINLKTLQKSHQLSPPYYLKNPKSNVELNYKEDYPGDSDPSPVMRYYL